MKLCSSLLFAAVALAQGTNDEFDAADRWGGYGNYYDYEVKTDGGQGYGVNQEEITDDLHFNGMWLFCFRYHTEFDFILDDKVEFALETTLLKIGTCK